jgi:hypothetical protein
VADTCYRAAAEAASFETTNLANLAIGFAIPFPVIAGRKSRRPMHTMVRVAAPGAAMARAVFLGGRHFGRP